MGVLTVNFCYGSVQLEWPGKGPYHRLLLLLYIKKYFCCIYVKVHMRNAFVVVNSAVSAPTSSLRIRNLPAQVGCHAVI